MSPRVSVLTATYNQERYVERCLESVRAQTCRDIEHIVVDDGSSDGTRAILETCRDIVYVPQENAGNVASRNRALHESSGEFVAVLDGDDWWDPQKLARQVAVMDRDPRVGLVYTGIVEVDEDSRPMRSVRADDITADPVGAQLLFNATPFSSMLIRRSALGGDLLLDPRFNLVGDRHLTLRIGLAGWAFACVADPLLFLRTHSLSMRYSAAFRDEYLRQMLGLLGDVAADSRLAPGHERKLRQAYAQAYFNAAWLMIDRGDRTERRMARGYLAESVRRWPRLAPMAGKQLAKATARSMLRRPAGSNG